MTPTPSRRSWLVLLIPLVVAAVLAFAGWLWPHFAPPGPERPARPLVGPADTITLSMRPGVQYLVYHSAPESEVGRVCRFGSPGHVAGNIGFGGIAFSDAAYRGIARAVTVDGQTYSLALRVENGRTIDVPISCDSGPVLVEEMPPYTDQAITARNVAFGVVAFSAIGAFVWWLALRRRRS
jgi:hypothetical protein